MKLHCLSEDVIITGRLSNEDGGPFPLKRQKGEKKKHGGGRRKRGETRGKRQHRMGEEKKEKSNKYRHNGARQLYLQRHTHTEAESLISH